MRDNSLVNRVVNRTTPSLEGSNLPNPTPPLDAVEQASGIEVAESIDELLPIEPIDPEQDREDLARLLDINENEPAIDPVAITLSRESLNARIKDALESEGDIPESSLVTPMARPQVSWDELQSELPNALELSPDIEDELEELAALAEVSDGVQVSLGMAKSMESASTLDLSYLNISLANFEREINVPIPKLTSVDNKVCNQSLESLEQWNTKLRSFVLDTFHQLRG